MRTLVRISYLLFMGAPIVMAAACSSENTARTSNVVGDPPIDSGPWSDTGGRASDSGVDADAAWLRCGNGVLDRGEECDPGERETPSCQSCRIAEHTLATLASSFGTIPTVAASAQGYAVMWTPSDTSSVLVRTISPSGAAERPEKRVDSQDGHSYSADPVRLAAGPNGFLASWYDFTSPGGHRFRPLNVLGEPQGEHDLWAKLQVDSRFYKMVERPDRNGFSLIHAYGERGIRQTSVSLDGVADPSSDVEIVALPESRTAAWLGAARGYDGSTVVAWMESGKMRDDPQEVHVASIKEGKTTWSTALPRTYDLIVEPTVAMLNDGRVFVAWYAGFGDRVEAAWIQANGTAGDVITLDSKSGLSDPSIAYTPNGELLVVWESRDGEILARRFAPNGEPTEAEPIRLTHAPSRSTDPVVAAGADGSFLVVYRQHAPTYSLSYQLLPPGFRKNP